LIENDRLIDAPDAAAFKHDHLEAAVTPNGLMLIELNAHHGL
jgi:hypothetical protein